MVERCEVIRYILLAFLVFKAAFVLPFDVSASNIEVLDKNSYEKALDIMDVDEDDVEIYADIFKAIKKQDFEEVDDLVDDLDSDILLGHVLAEKYLSAKYKSSFEELKNWLEKYNDHPQAKRIYALAAKKGDVSQIDKPGSGVVYSKYKIYENLGKNDYRFLVRNFRDFQKYINRGKTLRAKRILENNRFKKLVKKEDYDALSAKLAFKYFLDNYNKLAYHWASKAAKRTNNATASWVAGLATWRMKQYDKAAFYFKRLGDSGNSDEWLVSAGNYWAYRSYKKLRMFDKAQKYLKKAVKSKRTFYGLLAQYQLNGELSCNWSAFSYLNDFNNDEYLDELLQSQSMRRAVILIKAKEYELAEKEFRNDYDNLSDRQREIGLYLAAQFKMHSLAIMLSNRLNNNEKQFFYDVVAYPVPKWKPKSGWKEDRALLLALARQESSFSPRAISAAGAKGLMQLMPATAVHITKDKSLRKNQKALFEAEYNLELGQQYVSYLLGKPYINGNLFYLMVAYNAGPGNLYKWLKTIKDNGDPLMFIEAVPARETRIYIERVMANYWMYNLRLGKDDETLKMLLDGKFPVL